MNEAEFTRFEKIMQAAGVILNKRGPEAREKFLESKGIPTGHKTFKITYERSDEGGPTGSPLRSTTVHSAIKTDRTVVMRRWN